MHLFPHKTVEQAIIERLQKGPLSTAHLRSSFGDSLTKQGMYAALRKLVRAEIVIKHKQHVSLNVAWLEKLNSFAELAGHFYSHDARSGSFLDLADGERISYSFNSAGATDAFWNHVIYLLVEAHTGQPWVAYNKHCWFLLVRKESERALRDFIVKHHGQYLIVTGSRMPLDKEIRKEFDGKGSQYHMRERPLFQKNNYYLNVIGDFLIEVWIDPDRADALEKLYAEASSFTPHVEDAMRDIINTRGKAKLVVSRNKKRVTKLFKTLSKPFHIPKRARV